MGKLHTIRRAIQRDPAKWDGCGAARNYRTGKWEPRSKWWCKSYHAFVANAVKMKNIYSDVGNADDGQGGTAE